MLISTLPTPVKIFEDRFPRRDRYRAPIPSGRLERALFVAPVDSSGSGVNDELEWTLRRPLTRYLVSVDLPEHLNFGNPHNVVIASLPVRDYTQPFYMGLCLRRLDIRFDKA
ncbi:hypothetical protein RUM44_012711 [Polyplax serrata]|uniref:Uncharacterized protein n=1 Tax=Polyplax serrata TaxID=468196 RepID=A0ABR1BFX6_POLSC